MGGSNLLMRYQLTGQGQTVVLLNGLGEHIEGWQPQIAALEKAGFQVLAYDYRGHGQSEWRDELVDIYTFARDLAQLMSELSISQAHLAGLSMGTAIAQAFYHLHPEKVLSMVLAGGFSYFPEPQRSDALKARLEMIDKGDMREIGRILAERSFTENAPRELVTEIARMIGSNDLKAYRACMIASVMADSREFVADIRVPTLLLVGEGDMTTPPAFSQYLHEQIKGSKLVIIPGARHIVNLEQPDLFNAQLLPFLQQQTRQS